MAPAPGLFPRHPVPLNQSLLVDHTHSIYYGQALCDRTHRRSPEESDSWRQKVGDEARSWGRGGE